jgi:hypothetical protein
MDSLESKSKGEERCEVENFGLVLSQGSGDKRLRCTSRITKLVAPATTLLFTNADKVPRGNIVGRYPGKELDTAA